MSTPGAHTSNSSNAKRTNRLASSASAYLLQHAYNPVDWRPWGEEAFAEARKRDVPIFLSIGYSTCYWCHVMERESFENDAIAAIMNERFVCIKVDREERPDVDDIYMTATQVMTGHGGWPMSVFLEPQSLRPFWCGTYFPPEPRHGMGVPSFPQVLTNISEAFKSQRSDVLEQATQIAGIVQERLKPISTNEAIDGVKAVTDAVSNLLRMLDSNYGGFGGAPKFPQPVYLDFLLDARASAGSPETRDSIDRALRITLDNMMIGGIYDHLGGGFHRYSVDGHWTVPHFEKMLYDNALLIGVYTRAAAIFSDAEYARIAKECCEYVLREMLLPDGAFASAQDAEVDGREGLNYLWTAQEVRDSLDAQAAEFAIGLFSLKSGPNFRDPHHPSEPARNVLRRTERLDAFAAKSGQTLAAFHERFSEARRTLLEVRSRRKQPGRDDKILAAWNGLMISGLANAGKELNSQAFIDAARRAADFVLGEMVLADGKLVRSWSSAGKGAAGFLEDYAFVIRGLLDLASVLGESGGTYTRAAQKLANTAHAAFADKEEIYFDVESGAGELFVRARSTHDGAIPCGSSVMLHDLLDLHRSSNDEIPLKQATGLMRGIADPIQQLPLGIANATRAVLRILTDQTLKDAPIAAMLRGTSAEQHLDATFTPVEMYASEERISLGLDQPASFKLILRVASGYHVIAADPWSSDPASASRGLIPFRVHVVGGSGIKVYADYPAGTLYEAAAKVLGKPHVYEGEIEFEVAVELDGEMKGKPLLAVTFQACSGTECQLPRTAELDIAIDRI